MNFSNNHGNTAVIIVVIFLAAIVMFIFPLTIIAGKKDDTTALEAQRIVTEYSNKWRTTCLITQEDLDNLNLALGATGRAYEVELKVDVLDSNPVKKASGVKPTIGEGVYITYYLTQIEEQLPFKLKEGDNLHLSATTKDMSLFEQLVNWAYSVIGNNPSVVEDGGICTGS